MFVRRLLPALVALTFAACGGDKSPPAGGSGGGDPHATPQAVAEALFAAARTSTYAGLAALIDPKDPDGDARKIGAVAGGKPEEQAGFRDFFGKGKIAGDVKVEGDAAEVPILFGPDGAKPETFHMVRVDGKWYLRSF
jgi:hypothetical protein